MIRKLRFSYQLLVGCVLAAVGQVHAYQTEELAALQAKQAEAMNQLFEQKMRNPDAKPGAQMQEYSQQYSKMLSDERQEIEDSLAGSKFSSDGKRVGKLTEKEKKSRPTALRYPEDRSKLKTLAHATPTAVESGRKPAAAPVPEPAAEDRPAVAIDPGQFEKELNFPGPKSKKPH